MHQNTPIWPVALVAFGRIDTFRKARELQTVSGGMISDKALCNVGWHPWLERAALQ